MFLTLAVDGPPGDAYRSAFAMFGVYGLVFGGFAGAVLLGAVSDPAGDRHGPTVALTLIGPVCAVGGALVVGSRHVRRDITIVIEDVLERYAEGRAARAVARTPPCRCTTSTSSTARTRCCST